MMRPRQAMSAFIMLAILMGSSVGCIGLIPAREFMEDMREPPKMIDIVDKINVEYFFVTKLTPILLPDPASVSYTESFEFDVDSDVTEISAYITAAMAADFLALPSQLTTEVRYVEATLTDANGDQVWIERLTETKRPAVATFEEPFVEGTWRLDIDARGYGEEGLSLYKDSFQVLIKIERECWEYPTETGCSYD
jgi:hypothetical protein|tara:strand:+ start:722 stop:1306 length:585 start_codon:yes stop_codon:yes gene_type:complete